MGDNNQNGKGGKRIRDEEGSVDQRLKDRIIDARSRVAERKDGIYVKAPLEGVQINESQAVQMWSTSVRQYLLSIEPLLRSDKISHSHEYYEEIKIVDEPVFPPDGEYPKPGGPADGLVPRQKYHWSLFYQKKVDQRTAFESHEHNNFTRGFRAPEPKRVELYGLRSIIETESVFKQWTVVPNPDDIKPEKIVLKPTIQFPLRREWLRDAVRYADEFLQESGIAVDIGFENIDDKETDPV